jgi:hypothetical protein
MAEEMHCPNCGIVAEPSVETNGSFLIEIVLWLFMIVPGLLYTLWRLTTRYEACPCCGAPNMIPLDSPKALAARRSAMRLDR